MIDLGFFSVSVFTLFACVLAAPLVGIVVAHLLDPSRPFPLMACMAWAIAFFAVLMILSGSAR